MLMEEDDDIFHSPEKEKEERDIQTHDVEERKKLELMRATLEKRDPSCKDVDEPTLRRFLRARDLETEKASAMLVRCLSWRRTFVPKGFVSESEVLNEIAQNKMFLQGIDKQGRPVSVVFGSRHFSRKGGLDEFRRFLVFALDKLCQRCKFELRIYFWKAGFQMEWGSSRSSEIYKDMDIATAIFVQTLIFTTGSCFYCMMWSSDLLSHRARSYLWKIKDCKRLCWRR